MTREMDASGMYTDYIDESYAVRRTIDVRLAEALPGASPSFSPSIQVSRYLFGLKDGGSGTWEYEQVQFNPPNYPLFQGGTAPFVGDYLDIAPSPPFVLNNGTWEFNTEPTDTPVFHVAWTDNRDVRPPSDNNWTNYNPPSSNQGIFGSHSCGGTDLQRMGMRNQNIYTSRISPDLDAGVSSVFKSLGTLGSYHPDIDGFAGETIPRVFAVTVGNTTDTIRCYRLSFDYNSNDIDRISFLEFDDVDTLDVEVAPFSTTARPIFVTSTLEKASVTVNINEINFPGGSLVPGGLSTYVYINPDLSNPITPSGDLRTTETHTPNIRNPNIRNWWLSPNIRNPNIANPNIANPNIANPNIANPNIRNPNIANPNIANPNIANPNIRNPNIANPNIRNPNIRNTALDDAHIAEAEWEVTNEGNTVTTYTFKTYSKETLPEGVYAQLIGYRVHKTPGAQAPIQHPAIPEATANSWKRNTMNSSSISQLPTSEIPISPIPISEIPISGIPIFETPPWPSPPVMTFASC